MKVPNADRAFISSAKLRNYLLSPNHPVGRFKYAFFTGLGYSDEDWKVLERDLRQQIRSQNAVEVKGFQYGRKFVITGSLKAPVGRTVQITTVWVILMGEDFPRFITAYPGG